MRVHIFLTVLVLVVEDEDDDGGDLPRHQYLLSLLASLVYLFLPAERQNKKKVVESCVYLCIWLHRFSDKSFHIMYHHTL